MVPVNAAVDNWNTTVFFDHFRIIILRRLLRNMPQRAGNNWGRSDESLSQGWHQWWWLYFQLRIAEDADNGTFSLCLYSKFFAALCTMYCVWCMTSVNCRHLLTWNAAVVNCLIIRKLMLQHPFARCNKQLVDRLKLILTDAPPVIFREHIIVTEMPSLPFPAGDSRIWTSTTASRMAGPISRFHLLPTAHPAVTATCTLVKPLFFC